MGTLDDATISAEQAMELGSQIAALAKAGLPLGAGLRAMAAELPRRTRAALEKMADQVDQGVPLEQALQAKAALLPGRLRAVVAAASQSGRLVQTLEPMLALERSSLEVRRRVWLALAYPSVLLVLLIGLHVLFSFFVVPEIGRILFGFNTSLPAFTQVLLALYSPGASLMLVVLAGMALATGVLLAATKDQVGGSQTFLYRVPVVGPLWRFQGLARLCRVLGLLLELEIPVAEALRQAAEATAEADLRKACRAMADRVERGEPLADALARSRRFPPRMEPLARWGERNSALPEALRAAAEMFEGQVVVQGDFLETMLLPLTCLLIVTQVLLFVAGLLVPLLILVRALA
jgi:type II secretory pathway component PulF